MLKVMNLFFFLLLFFFQQTTVLAAQDKKTDDVIKNLTVNDYLQQKKAEAIKQGRHANHLIDESSPYLLQHAYNPVNWYPWGEEAFAKARKENKPIFLSIGYSTCHWCHVMARESFENAEIAAILNKYFISIKVDREQRPDIDTVYMAATQLINGHGGWPMSVFLDTHLRPFHAATYYPPFSTDKYTGLKEILMKVNTLWREQPETLDQVAAQVTARIIAYADDTLESEPLDRKINERALQQIINVYDPDSGGFGAAPKFPRPGIFFYLNRLSLLPLVQTRVQTQAPAQVPTPAEQSITPAKMMKTTLDAMAAGGIYDQLGGGFHRYSVDESWQVPHFEKMLYSQALLVMAYSDFYRIVPDERYEQIVFETLRFVNREMRSADGGFYSALDADSERPNAAGHAEGAYYLWSEAELKSLLSENEFRFTRNYFDIREHGNILSDPQQEFTDLNILYIDEAFKGARLT
ncbi:MAG: thioredoxin domain-containing protein, partial [Proteobacteria bacterium]|nr:thioredoxin domain-containing protein [Pseudomonadota bacterium]